MRARHVALNVPYHTVRLEMRDCGNLLNFNIVFRTVSDFEKKLFLRRSTIYTKIRVVAATRVGSTGRRRCNATTISTVLLAFFPTYGTNGDVSIG